MREIVLDTETTGLDPHDGHRVVEIGCIELLNFIPTGQHLHLYLNAERDMPEDAFRVHGLSAEFLADKPLFSTVVDRFLEFVGDARLIIHNAEFDVRFLNFELNRVQRAALQMERVLDTLALARRKFPGQANSLDALCQRYGIDGSRRVRHGALLDAEILAEVYAELSGGRQTSLGLGLELGGPAFIQTRAPDRRPVPLLQRLTSGEAAAHAAFVATLGKSPIWHAYAEDVTAASDAA